MFDTGRLISGLIIIFAALITVAAYLPNTGDELTQFLIGFGSGAIVGGVGWLITLWWASW